MKVLITGGNGFIGTNLALKLRELGHDTLVLDTADPKLPASNGRTVRCSLLDAPRLAEVLAAFEPKFVFHAGARTDLRGKHAADYDANVRGTENLILGAAQLSPTPHLVHFSSRLVFSVDAPPTHLFDYSGTTPYGQSKIAMENLIRGPYSQATTWTIVRPTSIWGPWFDIPYRSFFDQVRARRFVKTRGFAPRKSFGFVGNAVHQLAMLLTHSPRDIHQRVLWLTDYEPLDVNSFADVVADEFGVARPLTAPRAALRTAARLGDVYESVTNRSAPLTTFRLNNLLTDVVYDTGPSQAVFGAVPFSLEEGVRRTVAWMREPQRLLTGN